MDERYDMMRSVMDSRWLYVRNFRPDLPYVEKMDYMFQARGYQSWERMAAEGKLTPDTARFWGPKPTEELYDMDADPDSVKNLAADPAQRQILERMRAELKRRVLTLNDNGFIPEGSPLEGYDASHKEGAYPVEKAFETAMLASARNAESLPKLLAALEDASEPVRWWAAQGCTMLGMTAAPAEGALRKHLGDSSASVQIAAAEALTHLGKPSEALPVLERWVANLDKTPYIALQAANVLDRMGETARPSLPVLKEAMGRVGDTSEPTSPGKLLQWILKHTTGVLEGQIKPLVYPSFSQKN
jgi:hypothetical protein